MIQRIQSIYLFLASMSLAVMFFLPIYTLKEKQADGQLIDVKLTIQGRFERDASTDSYILVKPSYAKSLMTLVIGLGIFVTIFRYQNRQQQLRLSRVMIVLNFVLIITLLNAAYKTVNSEVVSEVVTGYAVLCPSITVVLTALAARAIKKDEELVKSSDRLR
jgi:hypothetical protein